jgi:Tfp pilus assembly protein PilF
VTTVTAINPTEFVNVVQAALERQDLPGLLALIKSRWQPQQIVDLLHGDHRDAKKVALLAIGLVGPCCCTSELAAALKDPDPVVNDVAEHALWSLWFRSGTPEANRALTRGSEALGQRDFKQAMCALNEAIKIDPGFAEAYNQRAIAHFLQEEYELSLADCRRVVRRMPCHFGALAGMGHCFAHLGQLEDAVSSYEQALKVNPHMCDVRKAIVELKRTLGSSNDE